ncbi:DUF2442 domain-containing protein [Desulfobacter postgatei]|uniref:DUF2442 domain-containing protein n=1 Tax=Desulfobacter postgatei 2ac9 TaxID=879212 RepID=I5B4F1_9BACT|nr:DUF2442 domain-containing protein [Desulfobacter postgatei]EIM64364.1 Protein of unknown function (DUF2442) [Desulfobacter postgatei 2ac9]
MIVPKIKTAVVADQNTLVITFDNGEVKQYNISRLLTNEVFSPLKNQAFFKNVKVEPGGYAVYWNDMIDISEYELWKNGISDNSLNA